MSFGYSVGDIVLLGQLAWKAYRSCKDAPGSFKNISHEVLSLHALLKEIEENLSVETLSSARQARLEIIGDGCHSVLEELQSLVDKYESLGTQSKRTWDRMKWGSNDIAELRSRLTSNTLLLTAFISTTQVVVEKKLDEFLQEFRDGKREGSVVTTQTVESLSTDEKQTWRIIRKELEDIGITVAAFDTNKDFIINWFKSAIATGAFEEQTLEDVSSSQTCEDDLDQLWEDPQYLTAGQSVTGLFDPPTIRDTPTRNPVTLEAQSTQILRTQKETSSAFLPTDELSTSAKTLHMQATQKAPQKALMRRERVPRVVSLTAWAFRYDKGLINAASQGQEVAAQQLLEKGADVNAKGKDGWTALRWAAFRGHEAMVRLLLEKGAFVNVGNGGGGTTLHLAAGGGHGAVARLLLEKGAYVNAESYNRRTALHWAAEEGHEAVARLLLEKGANVNVGNGGEGTALHLAAGGGHGAVARLLLEKRADVNSRDKDGRTALCWAAHRGHEAVVRQLLEKGAYVNAEDYHGWTALHFTAKEGHEAVARQLLEKGAGVNAASDGGWTALHLAAKKGHGAVARLLLEKRVDVNARDKNGRTALYWAVRRGHEAVVRQLPEKGADVDAKDGVGWTALHCAAGEGHEAVTRLHL
ncbi:MAG: hypothetical protein M1840_004151 [Geoglossum simile]|nr:MAG: hypothetical protein M1840_004151 [Geoglossum simile]